MFNKKGRITGRLTLIETPELVLHLIGKAVWNKSWLVYKGLFVLKLSVAKAGSIKAGVFKNVCVKIH